MVVKMIKMLRINEVQSEKIRKKSIEINKNLLSPENEKQAENKLRQMLSYK